MKSDFKNSFTNILAGLVVVLTTLQQYFSLVTDSATGSIMWDKLDWKTILFNVLLAVTLWITGKDKDGKAKKYSGDGKRLLMLLLIPAFLIAGCSTDRIIVKTSTEVEPDSLGIEVTSQIVDAVFNSVSSMSADTLTFKDGVGLAFHVVPQLISSVRKYKTAVGEVSHLSDAEILALVSIGDNYELGNNADKIKQVFKVSLFAVQTYFVFYNSHNTSAEAFLNEYRTNLENMIYEELDKQSLGVNKNYNNGFGSMDMDAPQSVTYGFGYCP